MFVFCNKQLVLVIWISCGKFNTNCRNSNLVFWLKLYLKLLLLLWQTLPVKIANRCSDDLMYLSIFLCYRCKIFTQCWIYIKYIKRRILQSVEILANCRKGPPIKAAKSNFSFQCDASFLGYFIWFCYF